MCADRPTRIFLKEWRQHFQLTGTQFAGRIGMSLPAYHRIEGGFNQWTQEFLSKAAEALGVQPTDLFRAPSGEDSATPPDEKIEIDGNETRH